MEKYENIIKIEEIRRLTDENQYMKALKVLDTIDVKKIKSLTDLSIIADVYTKNENYDLAAHILKKIYAKNKARRILYQLVDVSIKRGNISDGEAYLNKYIKIAPNDSYRFIFGFCLDKLKGEPYEVLIESLERLKEYEYYEKWAYELAKLYHKAGMRDKCIRECSDIVLWFGEGIYATKAKLLKAYYVGEIDPVNMLKTKDKEAIRASLGLDKTKDYSTMQAQINKMLAEEEKEIEKEKKAEEKQAEEDRGIIKAGEINPQEVKYQEEIQEPEKEAYESSAYEDILASGIFDDYKYEEVGENESIDVRESVGIKEPVDESDFAYAEESESIQTEYLMNLLGFVPTEDSMNMNKPSNIEAAATIEKPAQTEVFPAMEKSAQTEATLYMEKPEQTETSPHMEKSVQTETSSYMEKSAQTETSSYMEKLPHTANHQEREPHKIKVDKEDSSLKGMFGYYIVNEECKNQIVNSLERVLFQDGKKTHFIITGHKKSGKTYLGKGYAKFLYEQDYIKTPRVAKISSKKLNKISLKEKVDSLLNGTVIIEEASHLSEDMVKQILFVAHNYDTKIYFILEDEKEAMEKFLIKYPNMEEFFLNRVHIPLFTSEDLYGLALCFIENTDYQLSVEGKQRVRQAVQKIEQEAEPVNRIDEVIRYLDKVKASADNRYKSILVNMAVSKEMDYNSLMYITEEDFIV